MTPISVGAKVIIVYNWDDPSAIKEGTMVKWRGEECRIDKD